MVSAKLGRFVMDSLTDKFATLLQCHVASNTAKWQ
jgi:hypothetical protein